VLAFCRPGDKIALAAGAYYGTGVLFGLLGAWGLSYEEFDQSGAPPARAQLVWVEAPSNPLLGFPDLEAAATHPAPLVVDSTASRGTRRSSGCGIRASPTASRAATCAAGSAASSRSTSPATRVPLNARRA